jgi:hypothetical protein
MNLLRLTGAATATLLAVAMIGGPVAAMKTTVGSGVNPWSSATELDVLGGIYPIGGSGQVNGNFTKTKHKHVVIAMRISERFAAPPVPIKDGNIGIYRVPAGTDDGTTATWNYDIHVDLRSATGKYKGKTLGDYELKFRSQTGESLFGCEYPCDLANTLPRNVILFQTSQNPVFGNAGFNFDLTRDYRFQLKLIPLTFDAKPLNVVVKARVQD